MPRAPRNFIPNGIYHIAARGSDRGALFLFDGDRRMFLRRLVQTVADYELSCLSYCLMGNHYHLIVRTPDARLSKALQELNGGYSRHFNQIYGRDAHLFRNRFLARLIASEVHLLTACRYVAHNPVQAGLCGRPLDWPWSSYRTSAGLGTSLFVDDRILRDAFGPGPEWRRRYRDFVESNEEVEPPPGHKELLI